MPGLQISVNVDYFAFCHRNDCFLGGWGLTRYNAAVDILAAVFTIYPHRVYRRHVHAVHLLDRFTDLDFVGFFIDLKSILSLLVQVRHLLRDDWAFQYVHVLWSRLLVEQRLNGRQRGFADQQLIGVHQVVGVNLRSCGHLGFLYVPARQDDVRVEVRQDK